LFERLFELLFKYRPVVFEQGELAFGASWPVALVVAAGAAAAAVAVAGYLRPAGESRRAWLLVGLRVAVLGLILVALLRPVLVIKAVEPQQNFVGILLDDTRSMQVADGEGEDRRAVLARLFGAEGPLVPALAERFTLRWFRFSSSAARIAGPGALGYDGTRTDLTEALVQARAELAGVPLSGLVVVTDGADNAERSVSDMLRALGEGAVPVYTVGLGREALDRDIQLGRAQVPPRVLKGGSLLVDVVVTQSGYAGRTVPVLAEDEGKVVGSVDVTFGRDGEPVTARIPITASEAGPRLLRFHVPLQPGEMVAQNNAREALVVVEDEREKILYIEGEPRFEMKFIRRAVLDDENLQLSILQRTAENKFLRLGVDDAEDLAGGFPKTRDELFRYRGLILGSIEASFFTPDQLRMIADFASMRGGGLLVIGGHRAFTEGGYAHTPVADALPVAIDDRPPAEPFLAELQVQPTRAGASHAATQVAATEAATLERWKTLPPVTTVNRIRRVKPGATTLLTAPGDRDGDQIVLAFQRYGAGKTIALTVQDTWLWQMHADVPLEDQTHETLWRRMLRWLVDGATDRLTTTLTTDRAEAGEPVELFATVRDETFGEVNDGRVRATVVGPDGSESTVPLDWSIDREGEYAARIVPEAPGLYEVRVEAERAGEPAGSDVAFFRSAPSDSEYFDAGMRRPLLERIAEETGGRFYTADTAAGLPEDLQYTGAGVTVVEEKDLWDMPALLGLLVILAGVEWTLRRQWGFA